MVCLSRGRMIPPISRRVVLSLTDSQRTVQCFAARLRFLISLKEKLSISSSMTSLSMGGVVDLLRLAKVLESTRGDDQEPPRCHCCVVF